MLQHAWIFMKRQMNGSNASLLGFFKAKSYQSNHSKLKNIHLTEFKTGIQIIVELDLANRGHFENFTKSVIL